MAQQQPIKESLKDKNKRTADGRRKQLSETDRRRARAKMLREQNRGRRLRKY